MRVICPVCGEDLVISQHDARCENGHLFDRAAAGYFNLLLSSKKHAKEPGDNHDMVLARRRFLDAGYYKPLRDMILHIVAELSPETLVDAGCGEGYYTGAMSEIVQQVLGVDLARDAVLRSAKRDKRGLYCVGSIFHLPVPNASISLVTSIFAPYSAEEFARVVKPHGYVLAVIPGREHLWGLKNVLYGEPYYNDEAGYTLPEFELVREEHVDYRITLEGELAIHDLFMMTPYYWKTPRDATERLFKLPQLETQISFRLLLYRKK